MNNDALKKQWITICIEIKINETFPVVLNHQVYESEKDVADQFDSILWLPLWWSWRQSLSTIAVYIDKNFNLSKTLNPARHFASFSKLFPKLCRLMSQRTSNLTGKYVGIPPARNPSTYSELIEMNTRVNSLKQIHWLLFSIT